MTYSLLLLTLEILLISLPGFQKRCEGGEELDYTICTLLESHRICTLATFFPSLWSKEMVFDTFRNLQIAENSCFIASCG